MGMTLVPGLLAAFLLRNCESKMLPMQTFFSALHVVRPVPGSSPGSLPISPHRRFS